MRCIRVIGAIASLAALLLPAYAGPSGREAEREAAYLQEAFGHDLCARDDHDLRKLNKALSKRPVVPAGASTIRR
jgi:hypothetical protein